MNLGRNSLLEAARKQVDGSLTRAEVACIVVCAVLITVLGVFA